MPNRVARSPWAPLLVRRNPLRQWTEKEWWFAYAWDPVQRVYVSWAFVRAIYGDHFGAVLFEEGNGGPLTLQRSLLLDRVERDGRLCLENAGRLGVTFEEQDGRFTFRLAAAEWKAELRAGPSPIAPFARGENQFVRRYSLIHSNQNPVEGAVAVGGRSHAVRTTHSYFDHCFGDVPARTGWHWLAVQNPAVAVTSLVNYGPYAQLYTQVHRAGAWTRLSQDVTFCPGPPGGPWRVTSPDLDLEVTPLASHRSVTRLPPLLPLVTNLTHTEFVVRASGDVRVDGAWERHDALVGVMEEHGGRW